VFAQAARATADKATWLVRSYLFRELDFSGAASSRRVTGSIFEGGPFSSAPASSRDAGIEAGAQSANPAAPAQADIIPPAQ